MSPFSRGSAARSPQSSGRTPICRPCTDGDCSRCPTAITRFGSGSFASDYDCPHFHEDEDAHQAAVEEADAQFYERQHDNDNRWDSAGGQFDW